MAADKLVKYIIKQPFEQVIALAGLLIAALALVFGIIMLLQK